MHAESLLKQQLLASMRNRCCRYLTAVAGAARAAGAEGTSHHVFVYSTADICDWRAQPGRRSSASERSPQAERTAAPKLTIVGDVELVGDLI